MNKLPPIPDTCPDSRRQELMSARSAAVKAMGRAERIEHVARRARSHARSATTNYENLVAEVNGQGRLDF